MKALILILLIVANLILVNGINLTSPTSRFYIIDIVILDILLGFLLGSMEFDQ